MKDWKKITAIFTALVVVVALAYDVYAIVMGGTEASISHLIIHYSYDMPLVPFLVGVVCGHLFWRMRDDKTTKRLGKK